MQGNVTSWTQHICCEHLDNSAQMQIVKTGTNMHRLLCISDILFRWWLNRNTHRIVTKFIKSIQKSSCILYWLHMLSWQEIVCKLDHLLLKGKHQWKHEFLVIKDNTILVLQISWAIPKWKGQRCLSPHLGVYIFPRIWSCLECLWWNAPIFKAVKLSFRVLTISFPLLSLISAGLWSLVYHCRLLSWTATGINSLFHFKWYLLHFK